MTLALLWEEYRAVHPDGYGYSRYCELYTRWEGRLLYHPGDTDCRDQIAFRDALRGDPTFWDQLAHLKQALVVELGDQGRVHCAGRKTEFVRAVTASQNK